jgi:hypothetical protein
VHRALLILDEYATKIDPEFTSIDRPSLAYSVQLDRVSTRLPFSNGKHWGEVS